MKIMETIKSARDVLEVFRQQQKKIAFVPTMGNLHQGHLSLVNLGKEVADCVVVSIFINPLQFAPHEDFNTYPRTLQRDLELLQDQGATAVFVPNEGEMVHANSDLNFYVGLPPLSKELCGVTRPHFFQGVATIVSKLFHILQPHVAIFGEKDYQQLTIIRQMVEDLCFPVDILSGPTVREQDGLAMSSRNQYLSAQEREKAPELYQVLKDLALKLKANEKKYVELEQWAENILKQKGFRPDYVKIRCRSDLKIPAEQDTDLIILAAAWLGKTRLIDNFL